MRILWPLSFILVELAHLAGGCWVEGYNRPLHDGIFRVAGRNISISIIDHGLTYSASWGPENDGKARGNMDKCSGPVQTSINQPAIFTIKFGMMSTDDVSESAYLLSKTLARVLEANHALTWRDLQHIVIRTARPIDFLHDSKWSVNGVGRNFSDEYGFGLMDGDAIVELAKRWRTVPEQHICTRAYKLAEPNPRPLTGRFQHNFTLEVNGCETGTRVLYLEHVQVRTRVRYSKHGDLKLTLFSPSGTTSVLLPDRPEDFNANGFHKFLTVKMWGEDPRGTWTLMVESVATDPDMTGTFHDWALRLYGTEDPVQEGDTVHAHPFRPLRDALTRRTTHAM